MEHSALPSGTATKNFSSLVFLIPYLKEHKKNLTLAIIGVLIAALSVLALGKGFQFLIDHGFKNLETSWLLFGSIGVLMLVITSMALASFMRLYFFSLISEQVAASLKAKLFNHLLTLDLSFYETTAVGDLTSRLNNDTLLLQIVLGTSFPIALRNITIIIGGLVLLLVTSWPLTLLLFLLIPFILIPILFYGKRVRTFSKQAQEKIGSVGAYMDEVFSFIRTVQMLGHRSTITKMFTITLQEAFSSSMERVRMRSILTVGVMLLTFGGVSIILAWGGLHVLSGTLTAGTLSSFLFYAMAVAASMGSLSEIFGDIQRAAGAADRLLELFNQQSHLESHGNIASPAEGAFDLRKVSFSYPHRPENSVLQTISLRIERGEKIAIVGPSGSGKSTLLALLCRFYEPTTGLITFGDYELSQLDLESYRRAIGYIPQDPALFSTTIAANICLGHQNITQEQLEQAAKKAAIHDFILSLKEGYQSFIGQKGIMLSGGQKQRIAIARFILQDPMIAFLDEATNALDAENERTIQESLHALIENRTAVIVTHNLQWAQQFDKILVLEKGAIVGLGSHEDLMNNCPTYQRLNAASPLGE